MFFDLEHDHREGEDAGSERGGPSIRRGGHNRVWRRGDKHVQFKDRQHGISTGFRGGIRKKVRGTSNTGGIASRLGAIVEVDSVPGDRNPNAGRSRPIP